MDNESISMEIDDDSTEFTLAEVLEMNNLFKEIGEKATAQEVCEELSTKFSCSTHRVGKPPIRWLKVRSWFEDKQTTLAAKAIPTFDDDEVIHSKTAIVKDRAKVSTISASEAATVLPNLIFEARSAKDYAWFDVAAFLNYKVLSSGELVVRVRFAGFGKEEDEWVSVTSAVRERSIPLAHAECDRVDVGDIVLCYKETDDHALYCDARVLQIERRSHGGDFCTCIFLVRYDFTDIEEKVPLSKLCCRPKRLASKGKEVCKAMQGVDEVP